MHSVRLRARVCLFYGIRGEVNRALEWVVLADTLYLVAINPKSVVESRPLGICQEDNCLIANEK